MAETLGGLLGTARRGLANADRWVDEKVRYYGGPQAHDTFQRIVQALNAFSPAQDYRDVQRGSQETMRGILGGDAFGAGSGLATMAAGAMGAVTPSPSANVIQRTADEAARAARYGRSPWLIDTKVGKQRLQPGDYVEVDADGLVRRASGNRPGPFRGSLYRVNDDGSWSSAPMTNPGDFR